MRVKVYAPGDAARVIQGCKGKCRGLGFGGFRVLGLRFFRGFRGFRGLGFRVVGFRV